MRASEMIEWTKSLKKGDTVGIYQHSKQIATSTVERITPSGRVIIAGGSTYLPNGSIFGKMADIARSIRPLAS